MMNSRDFQRFLAKETGVPFSELDARTRDLRKHNLISSGPRGRHARPIAAIDAANMIGVMVARRAVDAFPVLLRLQNLTWLKRPGLRTLNGHGIILPIAAMLSMNEFYGIQRVEITDDGSCAWLRYDGASLMATDVDSIIEFVNEDPANNYDVPETGVIQRRLIIGVRTLQRIAAFLDEEIDDPERVTTPLIEEAV